MSRLHGQNNSSKKGHKKNNQNGFGAHKDHLLKNCRALDGLLLERPHDDPEEGLIKEDYKMIEGLPPAFDSEANILKNFQGNGHKTKVRIVVFGVSFKGSHA